MSSVFLLFFIFLNEVFVDCEAKISRVKMKRKNWQIGEGFIGPQGAKRESKPCHGNGMATKKMQRKWQYLCLGMR